MTDDVADDDEGNYMDLLALPKDDPIRERMLTDLGAEYRHITGYMWHPVVPDKPLARNTVNTLDGHWVQWFKWRAPKLRIGA